jgi:hypothetical protein
MKDENIQDCWKKFVGNEKYKKYFVSNNDVWYDNLEKVKKFIDTKNKRPSSESKNQDEKYLGLWILNQLKNCDKKIHIMKNEEIRECWYKFVSDEKYKEYFISNEDAWYDNLEKIKKFINVENKRPSSGSKNQDEKYLGNWIGHQTKNYDTKTKIMKDKKIQECWKKFVRDEKYKKYLMSNDEVWYDNFEKVKKFIDKESKRPSSESKNQNEKYLGKWIQHQSHNYNKKTYIMKDENIQECWKKFISNKKYKEYFMSNEDAWYDNLEKVKEFINIYHKRPSSHSENQDEKSLGSWIQHQSHNYNKKTYIMKDEKIYECWKKFDFI